MNCPPHEYCSSILRTELSFELLLWTCAAPRQFTYHSLFGRLGTSIAICFTVHADVTRGVRTCCLMNSLLEVPTSNMIPSQAPLDHSRSENHTQISEGAVTLSNIETARTRVLHSKFSPSRLATRGSCSVFNAIVRGSFLPVKVQMRSAIGCSRTVPGLLLSSSDSNRDASRIPTDFFSWPPAPRGISLIPRICTS